MQTNIQWTNVTDNIIRVIGGGWWCRKISDGCKNCYAAVLNQNTFYGGNKLPYTGEPPKLELQRDILKNWARQTKPKKHFVASMTDVFGDWVPLDWQFEMLDAMAAAPKQTFQILTKRADLMRQNVLAWLKARGLKQVPRNIWLIVSVENQKCANQRIPELLQIPCIRGLSCEPLLEEIKLKPEWLELELQTQHNCFPTIHWVIVGGESGKNARACDIDWIRAIVNQCETAQVPVFVKQLGAWPYSIYMPLDSTEDEQVTLTLKDKKGGTMEEWPEDLRLRQFPTV